MKRGLMAALFIAYAANTLDRQVLGILLEPIRLSLNLNDIELGILSGLGFALVFALVSVPAALWSAYGDRRKLVAVSALVWSTMMMFGGFATGFWHLLVARLGVAIGEAGSLPASHAMLSDGAKQGRRTSTLATFTAAGPVGVVAAFVVGGIVGQIWGWRTAMIVAGLPGLVIGLYLLAFERDVPRSFARPISAGAALDLAHVKSVIRDVSGNRGASVAVLAAWLNAIVLAGSLVWYPSFMIRVHGLGLLQAGLVLIAGSSIGMIGTLVAGRVIDGLGSKGQAWRSYLPAMTIALATPFDILFLTADNTLLALLGFGIAGSVAAVMVAPTIATLHDAVAPAQRATASALYVALGGLIGSGLGPLAVGYLSETVFAQAGARSLGSALLCLQIFGLSAALLYAVSGRALARSAQTD